MLSGARFSAFFAADEGPFVLEQMKYLVLADCNLQADGVRLVVERLAETRCCPLLARLTLNENPCGEAGARAVLDVIVADAKRGTPCFGQLNYLGLKNCALGDAGVRAVADALDDQTVLPSLQQIGLHLNGVSEAARSDVYERLVLVRDLNASGLTPAMNQDEEEGNGNGEPQPDPDEQGESKTQSTVQDF